MAMKKAPQRPGDQGDRVRNLQYSRELCVDCDDDGDGGICIPVVDSRPLHTLVDPSNLPSHTEVSYNAKKGTFKSREVKKDADETILRSAQSAQMKLGHHMVTGRQAKSSVNNKSIGGMPFAPMMGNKRGY